MNPQQIRQQFDEQGYVVVEDVLAPGDLAAIRDDYSALLDELAGEWYAEGVIPSLYTGEPFEQRAAHIIRHLDERRYWHFDIALPNGKLITPDTPVHLSAAVFHHLLRNPSLLDVVELFVGPEIYSSPIQHVRIKPPQAETVREGASTLVNRTGWHQDQGVGREEADNSEILTVWVAITDATEENGCLCVIPRSHRGGLVTHCPGDGVTIPESLLEPDIVPVPVKAGGALFMHRHTKHASLDNLSSGIRWSFDLRYQPTGQPTGRDEFPGFVARSRANPASELRDHAAWAEMWRAARTRMAELNAPLKSHRWDGDAPTCA